MSVIMSVSVLGCVKACECEGEGEDVWGWGWEHMSVSISMRVGVSVLGCVKAYECEGEDVCEWGWGHVWVWGHAWGIHTEDHHDRHQILWMFHKFLNNFDDKDDSWRPSFLTKGGQGNNGEQEQT